MDKWTGMDSRRMDSGQMDSSQMDKWTILLSKNILIQNVFCFAQRVCSHVHIVHSAAVHSAAVHSGPFVHSSIYPHPSCVLDKKDALWDNRSLLYDF